MRPSRPVLAFALFAAALGASAAAPDRIVLPDNVVPEHYTLTITPDADHLSFTGTVRIDVNVKKATRTITLNSADLAFKRVALQSTKGTPKVSFDTGQQTATLTFPQALKAGRHSLFISYAGKINQHAAGLFALDYDTNKGSKRALFTQFENSDARRFMPCWDEPGIKTTFTLSAIVPNGLMALSNTPVARVRKLKHGMRNVTFATTPKMSSYLLFFGLGDFERVSRKVGGVDIGVVVKRGDTARAAYALEAEVQSLTWLQDYFGMKYPLPKLDLIAGPGQSQFFDAMENWGAIFSFERAMLIDPRLSTEADQRRVYLVTAHEVAHMWFGDLVTMRWWDDVWLNEGFASWMEPKVMEHYHPEWKPWLDSIIERERAMGLDSRVGTHPVITPIRDVQQADQAFDAITYSKGMAVIRMLEEYVGPEAFREGVRAYIKAHAYGNTVSDDLWHEMDKATKLPVTQVAHDFTLQAGIPLIRVGSGPVGLTLSQDRYSVDDSCKDGGTWHVPVTVASLDGTSPWQGLVSRDKPVSVPVAPGAVPVVNYGQTAYFRTLYDAPSFKRVTDHFASLDAADQMGLLDDSLALGESGDEPFGDYFSLTLTLTPDMDPKVLIQVVSQLGGLDKDYLGLPAQAGFHAYARKVLHPVYMKLGWTAQPGESTNVTLLRTSLLQTLGQLGDPDVVAGAQSRFAAYLKDPASLPAELRGAVLRIVAEQADAAAWEQLLQLAKAAGSNLEKSQLYALLGFAQDETLAKQALALSLTDEVPGTVRPTLLSRASIYHPDLAFDFYLAHAQAYQDFLEPTSRPSFAARLLISAHDETAVAKLDAYAVDHIPAQDRGSVIKVEAAIRETAKIRVARLPEVDTWLAQQPR